MKKLQTFLAFALIFTVAVFCGVGVKKTVDRFTNSTIAVSVRDTEKVTVQAAEYIEGPLAANIGELCVFKLNDAEATADWAVIRQSNNDAAINAYIDSSGSSVVFASNVDAKYTVVAAVVESGTPKILQHVCEYGVTPGPTPEPTPQPNPEPKPEPEPQTLTEWVKQNVPEAAKSQSNILASVYESAASGIERGTIRTPEAAFSSVRTNTQSKIKLDLWRDFLDQLSEKVNERYTNNRDIKELGVIFSEIANGLRLEPRDQRVEAPSATPLSCSPVNGCPPQDSRLWTRTFWKGGRR
jgi:hypothetical protein